MDLGSGKESSTKYYEFGNEKEAVFLQAMALLSVVPEEET
jgi:hypothetical protein